jgi:hypothetical protein
MPVSAQNSSLLSVLREESVWQTSPSQPHIRRKHYDHQFSNPSRLTAWTPALLHGPPSGKRCLDLPIIKPTFATPTEHELFVFPVFGADNRVELDFGAVEGGVDV